MSNWQIGYKAGLKFRTGREGIYATGMLYYQDGFIDGDLEFGRDLFSYKPTAIGIRLGIVIGMN